ncbi:alpha/beta hydrolase [Asticcacaulis tiandongensis]|uniref:alpha/beta hydrolase n=1 Tax=Asticcacaulis tiandongensis TaxID=2565365 RepID=UPI0011267610|nr:alpha/beta fold hydrolase [Asticcacaulis tiandongensis]
MLRLKAGLCALLLASGVAFPALVTSQAVAQTAAPKVSDGITIERIQVHGKSLEGNLEGNDPSREVWVVLPPGYGTDTSRRYPVVYALHGYTGSPESWFKADKLEDRINSAFAAGTKEMILVFPNAYTLHGGSMYSVSDTTGDWETYITRDLVSHIDAKYRTLAHRDSRGLMGHSMGGYGTTRIGMKYPDVFSSLYAMSGCCLSARDISPEMGRTVEDITTKEQAVAGNFMIRATLAVASSWSPNPGKPPFFVDLPTRDGVVQDSVIAEWAANAPLAMVPQYTRNLRRYKAIAIDVGDRDSLIVDNTALHEAFERFGIRHVFEVYDGDHGSGVSSRFEEKVMPFFSEHLKF